MTVCFQHWAVDPQNTNVTRELASEGPAERADADKLESSKLERQRSGDVRFQLPNYLTTRSST